MEETERWARYACVLFIVGMILGFFVYPTFIKQLPCDCTTPLNQPIAKEVIQYKVINQEIKNITLDSTNSIQPLPNVKSWICTEGVNANDYRDCQECDKKVYFSGVGHCSVLVEEPQPPEPKADANIKIDIIDANLSGQDTILFWECIQWKGTRKCLQQGEPNCPDGNKNSICFIGCLKYDNSNCVKEVLVREPHPTEGE